MEGLSPGSGSLKPRTYIRGERGRRKTGRQDWTQEGLVASATGPFVLLHVPESHPFRGERSQLAESRPVVDYRFGQKEVRMLDSEEKSDHLPEGLGA